MLEEDLDFLTLDILLQKFEQNLMLIHCSLILIDFNCLIDFLQFVLIKTMNLSHFFFFWGGG